MLEIRPFDPSPEGLSEVAALLAEMFPKATHVNAAYLDWSYNANPLGAALGYNAYAGDRLVAHFASQPMRARIEGREDRGLLTQNAATLPEFMGKGLFTRLVERTMDAGAAAGFGFALALANTNSLHAFVNKLDFQQAGALDVKLGAGPTPPGDASVDLQFEPIWDEKSIAWRLARPGIRYQAKRRDDRCQIYVPSGILGISVEFAAFPAALVPESLPALSTANPIRVWLGLDPTRAWSRTAYFDIPMRLRPAPLNFTIRDLSQRNRRFDGDRVRFQAIDFDGY